MTNATQNTPTTPHDTPAPDENHVAALAAFLDLTADCDSNAERARLLLASNWMREHGIAASARLIDVPRVADPGRGCGQVAWCVDHEWDGDEPGTPGRGWHQGADARIAGAQIGFSTGTDDGRWPAVFGLHGLGECLSLPVAAQLVVTLHALIREVSDTPLVDLIDRSRWVALAGETEQLGKWCRTNGAGTAVTPELTPELIAGATDREDVGGWLMHHCTDEPGVLTFRGYPGLTVAEKRTTLANADRLLASGHPSAMPDYSINWGDAQGRASGYSGVWFVSKRPQVEP